ncbi:Lipid A core - O-antigen ligase [Methylophaga frappieri]|uniref:Lipid A core-O-antigen ligase n=1 Tax=Methylophaga frappieri (strain ATCC BAA-2434 / DSM 25690 / JAM7) TaxID=754477 RepID=I1YEV7_METFJ|nr:Wzy polymerase domain-containing protein [Methylophaga frappieri]AFJ01450.1 Lipid A core - O-antigen ligase [Methylophaga frappieri]
MHASATEQSANQHTLLSIASLICLSLMIAVPFLVTYHVPPIASFYKEWLTAVFGVFATLFLVGRNRPTFQIPVMTFVPLLLIVVLGLQIVVLKPDYWQNQFIAMLYMGFAALMIVLGANLRHVLTVQKVVPTLAWAFTVGATLIMVLLIISKFIPQTHMLAPWILDGRAGNIGQVNHFSNYIALAMASVLYLYFTHRLKQTLLLILIALFLIGLAQAGQRMAILYVLLISVGGWLLLKPIAKSHPLPIRPAQLLWLIPAFIVAQVLVPYLTFLDPATVPAKRMMNTLGGESTRLILLEQGWRAFQSSPWLGIGWAEFPWFNYNLTEQYPSLKGMWGHVHNIIAQLFAETGLIGGLIFLAGVVYWFAGQFTSKLTVEKWWLLALLGIIGAHSLLEFPLWYSHFLAFASLLIGLSSENALSTRFRLAPVCFIMVFVFGCWTLGSIVHDYKQLEQSITKLRQEGLSPEQVESNLVQFNDLRRQTLFTHYADNFFVRVLPNSQPFYADKLSLSQLVVENWPGRLETYMHAYLLAVNDQPVEAQQMMRKAIKQYPEYREKFHRFVLQRVARGEDRLLPVLIIVQDPYQPDTPNKSDQ